MFRLYLLAMIFLLIADWWCKMMPMHCFSQQTVFALSTTNVVTELIFFPISGSEDQMDQWWQKLKRTLKNCIGKGGLFDYKQVLELYLNSVVTTWPQFWDSHQEYQSTNRQFVVVGPFPFWYILLKEFCIH